MTDPNRLIDRYLDGKLSAEELEQLERDLTNPRYADRFAEAMLVDSFMHERYERDAITTSMRREDGSFMGEQDLALLMADYNNAQAELVDISRLAEDAQCGGARLTPGREPVDPITPRELVSIVGYLLMRGLKTPAGMAASAAAVLLLGVALFFALSGNPQGPMIPAPTPSASQTPTPRTPAVATLTNTHNAQWAPAPGTAPGPTPGPAASAARANPSPNPTPGSPLHPGTKLTLTQGFAEITTNRGAVAILQAPATIKIIDNDNAIELLSGKLVGLCHTQASKGFVVKTDHADITDLGTEFGVEVAGSIVTATVFTGKINFAAAAREPITLTTRQSATFQTDNGNQEVVIRDRLAHGFHRRLPRPDLITSATINLDGFEPVVVPGGVYEDAKIFTDRDYEFNGMDANGLPAFLRAGDLVQMPSDARPDVTPGIGEDLKLEIELSAPADIYLLAEGLGFGTHEAGPWLERDYERTTYRVGNDRVNDSTESLGIGPGISVDRHLDVWKRKQPASGRVVVGEATVGTMYAIVAVPIKTNEENSTDIYTKEKQP